MRLNETKVGKFWEREIEKCWGHSCFQAMQFVNLRCYGVGIVPIWFRVRPLLSRIQIAPNHARQYAILYMVRTPLQAASASTSTHQLWCDTPRGHGSSPKTWLLLKAGAKVLRKIDGGRLKNKIRFIWLMVRCGLAHGGDGFGSPCIQHSLLH